jgi:hypothetical protein
MGCHHGAVTPGLTFYLTMVTLCTEVEVINLKIFVDNKMATSPKWTHTKKTYALS